jgi:hypothetical protein
MKNLPVTEEEKHDEYGMENWYGVLRITIEGMNHNELLCEAVRKKEAIWSLFKDVTWSLFGN